MLRTILYSLVYLLLDLNTVNTFLKRRALRFCWRCSKVGHSGGNISSIMHLGLAKMLMWQAIKEERDGYSNIGRYRNIINVMLLCVMHDNK